MKRHDAGRHCFLALAIGFALVVGTLIGVRASTSDFALRAAPTINMPFALRAAPTMNGPRSAAGAAPTINTLV